MSQHLIADITLINIELKREIEHLKQEVADWKRAANIEMEKCIKLQILLNEAALVKAVPDEES